MNPLFYKMYIPKSMFITKVLQLIDENPDNLEDWACPTICCAVVCYCRNSNPVTRFVCYRFYT